MEAGRYPRVTAMIKRAGIFILLAVLSAFCIFGMGFALWSFNAQSQGTKTLGVHVTQSATLGAFSMPALDYVMLDGGSSVGSDTTITGVSFYKGDGTKAITDNSFTIVFTVKDDYVNDVDFDRVEFGIKIDVADESLKGKVEHTAFYKSRLNGANKNTDAYNGSLDDGYIDLKALTVELTDHFDDPGHLKSDFIPPDENSETKTFTFKLTTVFFNRCFSYISGQQPDSLEKYDRLDEANLKGAGTNYAPHFRIELIQTYSGATVTD